MVKQTQTIPRQQPTNCLSVFDHFVGLALKRLNHGPQTRFPEHFEGLLEFPFRLYVFSRSNIDMIDYTYITLRKYPRVLIYEYKTQYCIVY